MRTLWLGCKAYVSDEVQHKPTDVVYCRESITHLTYEPLTAIDHG